MPRSMLALLLAALPALQATASGVPDLAALAAAAEPNAVPGIEATAADEPAPRPGRFRAGAWEAPMYGSVTFSSYPGEIYLAHAGVSHYLLDGLAVSLEAVGGATVGDDTGGAVGCDLLLRWVFFQREGWALYAEGGAGMLYTTKSFKSNATHFNFTPQLGSGARVQISESIDLMGGVRWHHMSNADIDGRDRNIGFDGPMVYGGAVITF